jgi:hypothetical protein
MMGSSLARALRLALAGVLLPACGDDDATADASGPSSGAMASDSGASTGEPTSVGSDTTRGADPSTSGPSTISTSNPSDDSTTGGPLLCNGWGEGGPGEPWLELYDVTGQPLVSGGTYSLACGGQGSWMLPLYPHMGGWTLTEPMLVFSVEVVVEGFPGPFGRFYEEPDYYYTLQCFDDIDGGFVHSCIAVLPPDDIADLAALDGASATVHLELAVEGGAPLVVDLVDMTISAPADVVVGGCGFG